MENRSPSDDPPGQPARLNTSPPLIDQRLLKALAHPVRVHILDILSEGPSSPSRMHKRMENISLKMVSRHVRFLQNVGCVELIDVINDRGGKEHIYKATERQFINKEEWEAIEPRFRAPITATLLRVISEDLDKALLDGKFDELPDNHLSRSPLELDKEGWSEVVAALAQALDRVLDAHDKSVERAENSDEELMAARVVIMQFLIDRESMYGRVPPRGKPDKA